MSPLSKAKVSPFCLVRGLCFGVSGRGSDGDLVRIDGSPHDWFEGRSPGRTLIAHVDDATTRLPAAGFHAQETTEAYMRTTRAHLDAHGRPVACHSDRHSVFRVNRKGGEDRPTRFPRALLTLDIAGIHAGSPQAKGRVERANRTFQDRLVKEMRLRGIDGMAAGNAHLPEFMADFNRRFAVAPRNPADAHRSVPHDARELDLILCEQHARKLTKGLTVSFGGRACQVTGHGGGYRPRGAAVTVCKGHDGAVTVLRDGRELPVMLLGEGGDPPPVEGGRTVRSRVDLAKAAEPEVWPKGTSLLCVDRRICSLRQHVAFYRMPLPLFAAIAQQVEQLTCNEKVQGSIPCGGTRAFGMPLA